MVSTKSAMRTSRSIISHEVSICRACLFSLHHTLSHWTSRLFMCLLGMPSVDLLGISLLSILMPYLTILSRSASLTNFLTEGCIT